MHKIIEEDFNLIYSHTKSIWDKFKCKTLFITGATGFFGKCILQTIICANKQYNLQIKIIALSRSPQKFHSQFPEFKNEMISWINGDVKNFEFPTSPVDFIIHAATDVNPDLENDKSLKLYNDIVIGTRHVLDLGKIKNTSAILYISSGAVYGKQPHSISNIPESYNNIINKEDEVSSYSEGKRDAEMHCQIYNELHHLNIKIARCFSFVGPYLPLNSNFAIGNFINDAIHKKPININGDGTPFRTYLYTADLVIWLLKILIYGKSNYPYNVGSDQPINIENLAILINKVSRNNVKINIARTKKEMPPSRYVPSIDRARSELNLNVYTTLNDAILRTIKFNS